MRVSAGKERCAIKRYKIKTVDGDRFEFSSNEDILMLAYNSKWIDVPYKDGTMRFFNADNIVSITVMEEE